MRDVRIGSCGPDLLAAALTEFATAHSEPEVLELLQQVAEDRFGAMHAVLVTREPLLDSFRRIAQLGGRATAHIVHADGSAVERFLTAGAVFMTGAPREQLAGVPAPDGAARAVLLPCTGEDSAHAVCLFWQAGARPFSQAGLESMRLLATMAGMAFERQLGELRGRILRADLDNRVRNLMAVVRSVGMRSAEHAVSMDEFLLHFSGRIDAIGRSQVAALDGGEIGFEHLLREELLAQTIQDDANVSLEGMDVTLTAEQAEALGLSVHELAVNAVKFGAVAHPHGRLDVRWWVESAGDTLALNIDWRERCSPHLTLGRPDRAGFGLAYLRQALPFQLNAEVIIDFTPRGLRCQIAVPLDRTPLCPRSTAGAPAADRGRAAPPPVRRRQPGARRREARAGQGRLT